MHSAPLWPVSSSTPSFRLKTAARLLTEVTHKAFAFAAELAADAGLAPMPRRSGSLIRGVVTKSSNAASFSRPLPLCAPTSRGPTTVERSSRASATTKRSSLWHARAATRSLPCCAMAPFINPKPPLALAKLHKAPPPPGSARLHSEPVLPIYGRKALLTQSNRCTRSTQPPARPK